MVISSARTWGEVSYLICLLLGACIVGRPNYPVNSGLEVYVLSEFESGLHVDEGFEATQMSVLFGFAALS